MRELNTELGVGPREISYCHLQKSTSLHPNSNPCLYSSLILNYTIGEDMSESRAARKLARLNEVVGKGTSSKKTSETRPAHIEDSVTLQHEIRECRRRMT